MKKEDITIKVRQMDSHFLYLPFYYTLHKEFYKYIPDNYKVEMEELTNLRKSDEMAYKDLMDEPFKRNHFHLAICDPTVVLKKEYLSNEISPAILGALITNSAFWAVDHKTYQTIGFKDLAAYDKIISYLPGTTSYNIASRLYKVSGKKCSKEEFIKTVESNLEILELCDSPPERSHYHQILLQLIN